MFRSALLFLAAATGCSTLEAAPMKRPTPTVDTTTVTPLPPRGLRLENLGGGEVRISWDATPDPLEPSAVALLHIRSSRASNPTWGSSRSGGVQARSARAIARKAAGSSSARAGPGRCIVSAGCRVLVGRILAACLRPASRSTSLRTVRPDVGTSGSPGAWCTRRELSDRARHAWGSPGRISGSLPPNRTPDDT